TICHFLGRKDRALEQKVRDMATEVFRQNAPVAPDAENVLLRLRRSFSLALLTAGDRSIQEHSLRTFGYDHHFDAVRVVPRKNSEVLEAFHQDFSIDRKRAWVVGDSVRSDIEPAISLGIQAVHIEADNWCPIEHEGRGLPSG